MENNLTVKREVITDFGKHNLLGWLIFKTIVKNFPADKKELSQFFKDVKWNEKEDIECYMVIEGKKLPINEVCELWGSQVDRMVKEKALELLEEKELRTLSDTVFSLEKSMKRKAKKALGINLDEYD